MAVSLLREMAFLRLILILIAGGKPNVKQHSRIHPGLYPGKTAAYAHIDANRLRTLICSDTALQKAIIGENQADAYKQVTAQLQLPGITADALARRATKLRGIGAWYLGMPRLLFVADFDGDAQVVDILKALQKMANDATYSQTEYAGFKLHVLKKRRQGIWVGEANGFVAVGTDPIGVKKFLLGQRAPGKVTPRRDSIAQLIVRPDMIMNGDAARELTGYRLGNEELAAINVFDLPAYKDLTAELTHDGLSVTVELHKGSQAAKILQPAKSPPMLNALLPQKGGLGVAVQLAAPEKLSKHIETSTTSITHNNASLFDMVRRETKEELGIDLDKDLIGNIQSAAYIVPQLAGERDLEKHAAFAFRAKDAKAARKTFYQLVDHINRNGNVSSQKIDGGEYFEIGRGGRTKLGINNDLILIGIGRDLPSKRFLEMLTTKLHNKPPKGAIPLATGVLDLSGITGRPMPLIHATLARQDLALHLSVKLNIAKALLAMFSNGTKTTTGQSPFATSRIANNAANLKQIGLACLMFSGDNGGEFPKNFKALKDGQILSPGKVYSWIDPATGAATKEYLYFPGFRDDDTQATSRIIAADPQPYNGKRCVLFIDGHVEHISEELFRRTLKAQDIILGPVIRKADIPKAEQEAIRKLCRQLGSQSFKDRRDAKKKLKALGAKAHAILEEFKNNKDPEIRTSVRQLLP